MASPRSPGDGAAKPIWEKKNPKRKSRKMSAVEKTEAKRQARKHGRSKPSLVDNINASKGKGKE